MQITVDAIKNQMTEAILLLKLILWNGFLLPNWLCDASLLFFSQNFCEILIDIAPKIETSVCNKWMMIDGNIIECWFSDTPSPERMLQTPDWQYDTHPIIIF